MTRGYSLNIIIAANGNIFVRVGRKVVSPSPIAVKICKVPHFHTPNVKNPPNSAKSSHPTQASPRFLQHPALRPSIPPFFQRPGTGATAVPVGSGAPKSWGVLDQNRVWGIKSMCSPIQRRRYVCCFQSPGCKPVLWSGLYPPCCETSSQTQFLGFVTHTSPQSSDSNPVIMYMGGGS